MSHVVVLSELSDEQLHLEYRNTCAQYGEAVNDHRELGNKINFLQNNISQFKNESNRRAQAKAMAANQKKLIKKPDTQAIAKAEEQVEKLLEQRHEATNQVS